MQQFTQAELDAFWAFYVTMKMNDVISLTNTASAAYDPVFSAKLDFVFCKRLYGFADYVPPNLFGVIASFGSRGIWNGPTKS